MARQSGSYEPAHGSRLPRPDGGGQAADGEGLRQQGTGDLVRAFVDEGQFLIKEELRLARLEAKEEAAKVARAGAGFGAAGALGYTGLLCLAGCLVAVGAAFLPLWLSALFVGILFLAGAGAAGLYGKARIDNLEPARPVQGIKEEKEWLSDTMRSVRSRRHGHA